MKFRLEKGLLFKEIDGYKESTACVRYPPSIIFFLATSHTLTEILKPRITKLCPMACFFVVVVPSRRSQLLLCPPNGVRFLLNFPTAFFFPLHPVAAHATHTYLLAYIFITLAPCLNRRPKIMVHVLHKKCLCFSPREKATRKKCYQNHTGFSLWLCGNVFCLFSLAISPFLPLQQQQQAAREFLERSCILLS